MRTLQILALATLAILGANGRSAAQEDLRGIVERAIKAHGGEAAIDKHKAGLARTRGTIYLLGGISFTQEVIHQMPARLKEVMHGEINNQKFIIVTIFTGDKGWIQTNGQTQEMDDKQLAYMKEGIHFLRILKLTSLRDRAFELTSLGEVKVENRPTIGIRVSARGFKDVNLFFDRATGLLLKTESRTLDHVTMQEITEERLITEYQEVNGVKSPKKIVVFRDGKKFLDGEVTEVKLMDQVEDTEFARP